MVQSIDNRAVYSAVNIHITKPEVNSQNCCGADGSKDNGLYNAVNIDIDNPSVKNEPNKIYDYPQNKEIVTYNQLSLNPVTLPNENSYMKTDYEIIEPEEVENEEIEEIDIPSPNYTTTEAEKGMPESADIKLADSQPTVEKKTPEIVPPEDIKPSVDIAKVVSNLESADFDVQAQQMEEIAKLSLTDSQKAIPYIVKDVFTKLIEITTKDTTDLPGPTEQQVETRRKIIANYVAEEVAKQQNKPAELPFKLTEAEISMANEISPMEQAERNKEYAIYTISVLSKVYIDEIQKETGNVVPFTDIPGISDVVNSLRDNPNPGVKSAAIESLLYIARPEYKDELNTIFSIAKDDQNRMVSRTAEETLARINS